MLRYHNFLFAGLAVLALTAVIFGFLPVGLQSAKQIARAVVTDCKSVDYRPLCYEKKIPALMDRGLSMEKAFAVTSEVQILDPDYHYCHVLAHNISAKETAKDPSKWRYVVARAPSGMCGNGGLHGAFQERFRTDALPNAAMGELLPELRGTCDPRSGWAPTFLERSSCMHGIGHLTMYITSADINKSIALCETLAFTSPIEDFRRTCIDGAFMQIFQPLEPEDKGLVEKIAPTAEKRAGFCARFTGLARTSCIKESWPLVVDTLSTPKGFTALCAPLEKEAEEYRYCTSGLVYVVFGRFEYNTGKMIKLCAQLPEGLKKICVSRTASRFIETDWRNIPQALSVCSSASADTKDACYTELIEFASQGLPAGSSEEKRLCSGMPEPWNNLCATDSRVSP